MKKIFFFIARFLFILIFIIAGCRKVFNWSESVEGFVMTLCNWHMYLDGMHYTSDRFMQFSALSAPFIMSIAIFLEIIGGLLILFNINIRLGAFLLFIFLVPTTVLYHPFWFEIDESFQIQMSMFFKNLTILGALLYFMLGGPQNQAKKNLK